MCEDWGVAIVVSIELSVFKVDGDSIKMQKMTVKCAAQHMI